MSPGDSTGADVLVWQCQVRLFMDFVSPKWDDRTQGVDLDFLPYAFLTTEAGPVTQQIS